MRRTPRGLTLLLLLPLGLMLVRCSGEAGQAPVPVAETVAHNPAGETQELKLFDTVTDKHGLAAQVELKVIPGSEQEAKDYYKEIRGALTSFPQPTLTESYIKDMLVYNGFPALRASDLERLDPAILMDFEQLRKQVSNQPEFEAAYQGQPLAAGEILASRFFAPKIINVRDPQVNGVPKGGFGWRKVLRFRSRQGSPARGDGIDAFYLLFNFASNDPKFPNNTHAAQIQALLVPVYPTAGKHRDVYFLVYESLAALANPEKVGLFLIATFDLAGVAPDDKYYVPRSCGQCHGTTKIDQKGGKVNYLDTDHWIDRTGDDFKKVNANDVLVDGVPQAYATLRQLNSEIEKQNAAVISSSADPKFALLATRKWLELHKEGEPDANQHVPPLRRGFTENPGDPVWTAGGSPDEELLPLLNQYCFRCHSSVAYHVFQKKVVIGKKSSIVNRLKVNNMPQDRKLDDAAPQDKAKLIELTGKL